jgi:hypothetical protein
MGQTHMPYRKAKDKGRIVNKKGYHQCRNCRCKLETRKGAYRDVTIEVNGNKYHFYHQNLVVIELADKYILDSCGFRTKTTKERINRYIPNGYKVFQENFDWFISMPSGKTKQFSDKMEVKK